MYSPFPAIGFARLPETFYHRMPAGSKGGQNKNWAQKKWAGTGELCYNQLLKRNEKYGK